MENLSNNVYKLSHNIMHPEWTRKVSVGFTPWRTDKKDVYLVTYLPLTENDTEEENFYDLAYLPKTKPGPTPAPNTLKDYSSWVGAVCNSRYSLILFDATEQKYYATTTDLKNMMDFDCSNTVAFDAYRSKFYAFKRLIDLENKALRYSNGYRSLNAPDTRVGSMCPCCGYRMYFNVTLPVEDHYYFDKGVVPDQINEKPLWRFTRKHDPKIEKFCPMCGTLNPLWDLYPKLWAKYGDKANHPDLLHYSRIEKEFYPLHYKDY